DLCKNDTFIAYLQQINAKQASSTHRNKLRHLTIFQNWNTQRKTFNQQGQTVFRTKEMASHISARPF
ncbi:hypothetical protein, partial [Vibrio parahaemolyticus]|uniref:hypothetical protein n=1 Tax=Vibrio parahaemolyticus TaxID=670 RepID=UPI001C5FD35C